MVSSGTIGSNSGINGLMASEPDSADAKRGRIIFDADDADLLNNAVQLRASKRSVVERRKVSKSEVATAILREALREEIAELEKYASRDSKAGPKPRRPNGGG